MPVQPPAATPGPSVVVQADQPDTDDGTATDPFDNTPAFDTLLADSWTDDSSSFNNSVS